MSEESGIGTMQSECFVEAGSRLNLSVVIFAKDEEENIAQILRSLAAQSLCRREDASLSVYVIVNGSTDATALVARETAANLCDQWTVMTKILDWATPGKSRSWNRFIHEVLPSNVEFVVAIDADIQFADDFVLSSMLDLMLETPSLQVLSGLPIKDSLMKDRLTLVARFSTNVSRLASYSQAICGQLYLANTKILKEIWLPDETPAEDGFLNAMVRTKGFSQSSQPDVLMEMSHPTHYYADHSAKGYFNHEKRIIVGTVINRWIFEYLNSLHLSESAGPLIDRLNREQPDWVDKLIQAKSTRRWLIPSDLLFRRMKPKNGFSVAYLTHLPVLLLATALTFPPAFTANRILKSRGAASHW